MHEIGARELPAFDPVGIGWSPSVIPAAPRIALNARSIWPSSLVCCCPSCSSRPPIYSNATFAFAPLTPHLSQTSATSCRVGHRQRDPMERSRPWSHSQRASSAYCATYRPTSPPRRSPPSWSCLSTRSGRPCATYTPSNVSTRGRKPSTAQASYICWLRPRAAGSGTRRSQRHLQAPRSPGLSVRPPVASRTVGPQR